ncbi:hypothetical protein HMI54_012567 [Coelomomyces lativittatus]|nr:hypothetical protein HMI56_004487 [Coelomomyces lativittatus]KAJ1512846.1 hypothetical protein HMI55_006085 [Coelomomyces lativittatus]KAJ1515299.1 hypothetical protein HMI54_012567 [Coelomomyces lativittatus]
MFLSLTPSLISNSRFHKQFELFVQHVSRNLKTHVETLQNLQDSKCYNTSQPIQVFKFYSIRLVHVLRKLIAVKDWPEIRSPQEAVQAIVEIWDLLPKIEENTEVHERSQILIQTIACGFAFHLMTTPIWNHVNEAEKQHWEQRWLLLSYRIATWTSFIFHMNIKKRSSMTTCLVDVISNIELQCIFIFSAQHLTYGNYLERTSVRNNFFKLFSFLRNRTSESPQHLEFFLPLWGFMTYTLKQFWDQLPPLSSTSMTLECFQALCDVMKSITNNFLYVPKEGSIYYTLNTCLMCIYKVPHRMDVLINSAPYFTRYYLCACYYLLSSIPLQPEVKLTPIELLLHRVLYEFHLRINQKHILRGFRHWFEEVKRIKNDSEKNQILPSSVFQEMLESLKRKSLPSEKEGFYDPLDQFLLLI